MYYFTATGLCSPAEGCTTIELNDGHSHREFNFKLGENTLSRRRMKRSHHDSTVKHSQVNNSLSPVSLNLRQVFHREREF